MESHDEDKTVEESQKQQIPRDLNLLIGMISVFFLLPSVCSLNSYNNSLLPQGREVYVRMWHWHEINIWCQGDQLTSPPTRSKSSPRKRKTHLWISLKPINIPKPWPLCKQSFYTNKTLSVQRTNLRFPWSVLCLPSAQARGPSTSFVPVPVVPVSDSSDKKIHRWSNKWTNIVPTSESQFVGWGCRGRHNVVWVHICSCIGQHVSIVPGLRPVSGFGIETLGDLDTSQVSSIWSWDIYGLLHLW